MMKVGVAFYLEPHNPLDSSAWVSVEGGLLEFKRCPAYDESILWVTNVEQSAFIEHGISSPNFKHNDFIPGGLKRFVIDLGTSTTQITKHGDGVVYASEMLARAIRIIVNKGLCDSPLGLMKLGDSVRRFIQIDESQQQQEQAHASMCIGAYKMEFTNTSMEAIRDTSRLTVRFPHGVYAKHIANRPLPSGEFTNLSISSEKPALQTLQEILPNHTGFAMLKTAKSRLHALNHLTFTDHKGQWFALPEALEIAKQIQVKIVQVKVSQDQCYPLRRLISRLCGGQRIPLLTTTLGLLLHSTWEYLASQRLMRSDNSHSFPSSQASYVRAWDRMTCFKVACSLAKQGAIVTGYGHGAIQIVVRKSEVSKFLIHAYEHGMTAGLSAFGRDRSIERIFTSIKSAS